MEQEKPAVSLVKARLYSKFEELERLRKQHQQQPPPKPYSPVMPLAFLFLLMAVVIVIQERARYLTEQEAIQLRAKVTEQAETIRVTTERIAALQTERTEAARPKAQPKTQTVKRRKPKVSGQNNFVTDGYGDRFKAN